MRSQGLGRPPFTWLIYALCCVSRRDLVVRTIILARLMLPLQESSEGSYKLDVQFNPPAQSNNLSLDHGIAAANAEGLSGNKAGGV